MNETSLPAPARVVVIGGGIVGCSIAYHLTKLGWRDVVLLERNRLTSGTTWHAAGLVGQLRATLNLTRLAQYTAELYADTRGRDRAGDRLQAARQHLARDERRAARGAAARRLDGARPSASRCTRSAPADISAHWPLLDVGDVVGGVFLPKRRPDRTRSTPRSRLPRARGSARRAHLRETRRSPRSRIDKGRVTGVETDRGRDCRRACRDRRRHVVARARPARGVSDPAAGVRAFLHRHRADSPASRPTCRCCAIPIIAPISRRTPASCCSAPSSRTPSPGPSTAFPPMLQLRPSCPRISIISRRCWRPRCGACRRSRDVGIRTFFNGPESFTPDVRYMLGETPEVRGLLRRRRVQFDRHPVRRRRRQGAGGMDRRRPSADGSVGRRRPPHAPVPGEQRRYLADARHRVARPALRACIGPIRQYETARGVRPSPLHDRLAAARRLLRRGRGLGARRTGSRRRARRPPTNTATAARTGSPHAAAEHRAVREAVALFDHVVASANSWSRAATPRRRCSTSAPTTSRSRRAASSTRNG